MVDFLRQRADESIRSEISDLLDSYHHFWDVPAELVQNSVDAIADRKRADKTERGLIVLEVDSKSRTIRIFDNGIGIEKRQLDQFLVPGGGSKRKRHDVIGEKGVGLTYCIFSFDHFRINSISKGESTGATVNNAHSWVTEESGNRPTLGFSETKFSLIRENISDLVVEDYDVTKGTEIELSKMRLREVDEVDLFDLTTPQLKWVFRTLTAIGSTKSLWDTNFKPDFDVYYRFRLKDSSSWVSGRLEVGYPRLHEMLKNVEASEVQKRFSTMESRTSRAQFLKGKAVWLRREIDNGGKPIRVYAVMFPGNNVVRELAVNLKLSESIEDTSSVSSELVKNAIYMATKTMPTGVELPTPGKGKHPAYYKRCFFIVENDFYKYDMGRKTVNGVAQKRLKDAVAKVFQEIETYPKFQGGDGADINVSDGLTKAERKILIQQRWDDTKKLPDLNIKGTRFQKIPNGQEAGVAAVFHEMIATGAFNRYSPLHASYGAQYDLLATYQAESGALLDIIIEFKHSLQALVKDFDDGRKFWDEMDVLVCWDADEAKLKDARFELVSAEGEGYEGVTHFLNMNIEGADTLPVIMLSRYRK